MKCFLDDCWSLPARLAPLKDATLPDTLSETTLERSPMAMLVELYQVRFPLVCMKTPQDSQCHLFHSPLPALWYGWCWGMTRLRWSLLVCLATCCVQELWGRPQPRTSPCLSLETGLKATTWYLSDAAQRHLLCTQDHRGKSSTSYTTWVLKGSVIEKNTHLFCWCQIFTNCKRIPKM